MDETMGGWPQRWRAVLDDGTSPETARAVAQGGALLRSGRVTDVRVGAGRVSGRVQGAGATPYLVEITAGVLDDAAWETVVAQLAGHIRHGARLLAGHAPEGLEEELAERGIALFPTLDELDVSSPCRDRRQPCQHAAGVWEAVAVQLATDPFPLFRLRGRGRDRLMAQLAAARWPDAAMGLLRQSVGLPVDRIDATHWHRARGRLDGIPIPAAEQPTSPAGDLRLLGDPPDWPGGVGAWDLLRPLVEAAATYAEDVLRDREPSR